MASKDEELELAERPASGILSSPRRRRILAGPLEGADDDADTIERAMPDLSFRHVHYSASPNVSKASLRGKGAAVNDVDSEIYPPSFAESQFQTIVTRQVARPKDGSGFKSSKAPSRYPNLPNTFDFAGWGSVHHVELTDQELETSAKRLKAEDERILGVWKASGLAANEVLGSIFYAVPAVVAVAGVYSPLSMFIATLLIFLYRPIMVELGSAIPISGANYTYALNTAGKTFALVAAALTLLDTLVTAVVSAASAGGYLAGEISSLPFPTALLTFFVLLGFCCVALAGLKESARVALAIVVLHILTMLALMIAGAVTWAKHGNDLLRTNWRAGQPGSASGVARAIWDGICLSLLGMTGFETAPNCISSVKPGRYPAVLRNLHLPAVVLNGLATLMLFAVLPTSTITSSVNVFSALATAAGGRPLRIFVVVDAVIVLCAGVLTGVTGSNALFERLTRDRILSRRFLARLPWSGAQWLSIVTFTTLCCLIYASSNFSISVCSQVFAMSFLFVIGGFAVTLFMLKVYRPMLPRSPRCSLFFVVFTIAVTASIVGGNIALARDSFSYFVAYFAVVFVGLWLSKETASILKFACWLVDRSDWLRSGRSYGWGLVMVKTYERLRRPAVCCLVKTDEIDRLFEMLLYCSVHECTSNVKLIHFYTTIDSVPSELEANATIVDEAFPAITVDLVFVQGAFTPAALDVVSRKLDVDVFLMTCPSERLPFGLDELRARVVMV